MRQLDAGFSRHNLDLLRNASTQLFGRRFFDGFHGYWSQVENDETQPEVEREIAAINLGIEKVVISDSQLVLLRYDAMGR